MPLCDHGKLRNYGNSERFKTILRFTVVPKCWFTHFYALGLVANTLFLTDIFIFRGSFVTTWVQTRSACCSNAFRIDGASELGVECLLCLCMMQLQLVRRLWECLRVTQWGNSSMSTLGYLVGILHYQSAVLTFLAESPYFEGVLGASIDESSGLKHLLYVGWLMVSGFKARHVGALSLFFLGWVKQHQAIRHLASLRTHGAGDGNGNTKDGKGKCSSSYGLPSEGWFRFVSSPHYLAEALTYISFVVVTKGRTLGVLLMMVWVLANQALVAVGTHAWYLKKFERCPNGWKRMIPWVW
ncbi:unnamed protein product [Choristocarpus tenellus]